MTRGSFATPSQANINYLNADPVHIKLQFLTTTTRNDVNIVWKNSSCLFRESYETHNQTYTLWAKYKIIGEWRR